MAYTQAERAGGVRMEEIKLILPSIEYGEDIMQFRIGFLPIPILPFVSATTK